MGSLEIGCILYLFQSVVRDFFCSWCSWHTNQQQGLRKVCTLETETIQLLEEKICNFDLKSIYRKPESKVKEVLQKCVLTV